MSITPEQARAELQRRRAMASSTPTTLPPPRSPAIAPRSVTPPPQAVGLLPAIGRTAKNLAGGAVYGVSAPGRTILNGFAGAIGVKQAPATKAGFEKATTVDLDSGAGKTGQVLGEAGSYFAVPGAGALKGLTTIPRVATRFGTNAALATAQSGDIKKGLTTAAIAEGVTGATKPIAALGKVAYKGLAIPTSAREAQMIQTYKANNPLVKRIVNGGKGAPVTAADTAFDKGLMGTESMIGVQAKREQKRVWNKIVAPALKSNPTKVDLKTFFDDAERQIIKSTPEVSRQKALINALNAYREDYAGRPPVNLQELQDLKSGWAQFVPEKAYRGENIAGSVNDVRNTLAAQARSLITSSVKDPAVKRAYIDYGNLTGLTKLGQRAMTGGKFKGGTGGFLSASKDALLTPVATIGGQVTYRTAKGATYVAAPGAKTVSDLFSATPEEEQ